MLRDAREPGQPAPGSTLSPIIRVLRGFSCWRYGFLGLFAGGKFAVHNYRRPRHQDIALPDRNRAYRYSRMILCRPPWPAVVLGGVSLSPAIRPARLLADLERFAGIGRGSGGGVTRLAFSAADQQARELFASLALEAGLEVRLDRFGNLWAVTGPGWSRPAVVCGSHLDTVPNGGRFDGVLGVLAGLEVVRAITESGRSPGEVPLAVAVLAAEESSRFGVSTIGSKAAAGIISDQALAALRDRDGVSYPEALARGGHLDRPEVAAGPPGPLGCFLELHIEQGRELELAGVPLGVVGAIAAPTRFLATVRGEAAHSGATMMPWRKDGLAAASELVLALERIAELEEDHGTVATATIFALHPVSINVVPGRVEMGVDIRGIDRASKARAVDRFRRAAGRVSAQRGIAIDLEVTADEEPVVLSPEAVEYVRRGCERSGAPYRLVHSRAGHDSMNLARICPAGMLFVPSEGGLSHHPGEMTRPEHVVQGAKALLEAVLAAAAALAGRRMAP